MHIFPAFSYGKRPTGHWWNVLYGLAGYTRNGTATTLRTLWIPHTTERVSARPQPAPRAGATIYGMKAKVAVLGASGFAGAGTASRLLDHPALEVVRVCANDHVGELVSRAHPHLEGLTQLRFENPPHREAAHGVDAVIMGLPHGASVEVVDAVAGAATRIVDMSGAFRVQIPASYAQYYGSAHPRPELLKDFVYGLPELNRERIRGARFVASAGCFATTIELMLLPFAKAGLLRGSSR